MIFQEPLPLDAPFDALPLVVKKVVAALPKLNQLLSTPPKTRMITNQMGNQVEAFGFYRLAILQCFECLLSLGYVNLLKELMTNHVEMYKNFFDLIFRFSTNNFCPIFVERIFAASLSSATNDDVLEVHLTFLSNLYLTLLVCSKTRLSHLDSQKRRRG